MKTKYLVKCVRRTTSSTTDIEAWARQVVAAPAAHGVTPREAVVIASLLAQLDVTR